MSLCCQVCGKDSWVSKSVADCDAVLTECFVCGKILCQSCWDVHECVEPYVPKTLRLSNKPAEWRACWSGNEI